MTDPVKGLKAIIGLSIFGLIATYFLGWNKFFAFMAFAIVLIIIQLFVIRTKNKKKNHE